jgi:tetratricopeptide (TPR) repeat protein
MSNKTKRTPKTSGLAYAAAVSLLSGALAAQPTAPVDTARNDLPESRADDGASADSATYLRRARDTLIGVGDFAAALNPARQIVEEQQPSPDQDYAADLLSLASIQAEVGEFDEAETNSLKAIELVETAEGEFSITLVDPYRSLGRAYIKGARYPEAITALEQAQHISQRNLGLFNIEQAGLLDDITTAYLGLGDTTEARRIQLERVANAIRRFGADDPRVIPFRYQLADYYQRSRMQISAREQYQEVLKSQEAQHGTDHPQLLGPLRQLVKVDLVTTQGEEDHAYSRLISILEQNEDIAAVERGLSLAVLGDWATVTGDTLAAGGYYKRAWEALSSQPDIDIDTYFAQPVIIDFIAPLTAVDRGARSRPYAWAAIVFEFDLSADGRVSNVRTVGAEAPLGVLESRYNRRLRETHFRPRIVAGEPVATNDVQFTHYFRYYVNEDG